MVDKYLNNSEFYDIVKDLIQNDTVKEMKKYRQHFETSCFDHCITVSFYAYKWCKKFGLDYKSASRARNVA